MALERLVKTAKGLKNYVVPTKFEPFEDQLKRIRDDATVKSIFNGTDSKYHNQLEDRLRYHLSETRAENRRLKYFGATVDTIDKSLVPLDTFADAAGILTGIGYGISVGKELLELPFKIANTLYYTVKTREYTTPVKDLGYEVASFVVPGSLLDLTNRYSERVDKYVTKEAIRRFEKEVRAIKAKKPQKLVDIAEEFREVRKAA